MGVGGTKVKLYANMDSPDGSGKSVISAPLDSLGITEDQFWDYYSRARREPIAAPHDYPQAKVIRHEVTDLGPGRFQVLEVIGNLPWGEQHLHFNHSLDRSQGLWKMEVDHDLELKEVPVTVYTRLLSNPMRAETWMVNTAARVAGPVMADGLDKVVRGVLGQLRSTANVPVRPDAESPSGQGRSVLAGPLDGIIPPEQFWGLIEAHHRRGPPLPFVTSTRVKDLPNGFHVTQTIAFGVKIIHSIFHMDRAQGLVTIVYYDQGSSAGLREEEDRVQTVFTKLHLNPMLIEVWAEVFPKRHGEEVVKMVTQGVMDKVAEEADKERRAAGGAPSGFLRSMFGFAPAAKPQVTLPANAVPTTVVAGSAMPTSTVPVALPAAAVVRASPELHTSFGAGSPVVALATNSFVMSRPLGQSPTAYAGVPMPAGSPRVAAVPAHFVQAGQAPYPVVHQGQYVAYAPQVVMPVQHVQPGHTMVTSPHAAQRVVVQVQGQPFMMQGGSPRAVLQQVPGATASTTYQVFPAGQVAPVVVGAAAVPASRSVRLGNPVPLPAGHRAA